MTATITSKGQLTVPASIRDKLQLVPGSKVEFEERPNGDVLVRRKTGDIRALRGILKRDGQKPLTIEQMKDAAAQAVAEKLDRCR